MTDIRPSVEQILKRKFAGQSAVRVQWNDAKKKAGTVVDVSVFKEDLGPLLDVMNQLYQGALEVKRYYPTLDERTKKPVRAQKTKIETVMGHYKTICANESNKQGVTPAQKKAWDSLVTAINLIQASMIKVKKDVLD
jgi:hypothetical protein